MEKEKKRKAPTSRTWRRDVLEAAGCVPIFCTRLGTADAGFSSWLSGRRTGDPLTKRAASSGARGKPCPAASRPLRVTRARRLQKQGFSFSASVVVYSS